MQEDRPLHRSSVWDPFVRVFHWTLVTCVLLDYVLVTDGKLLHKVVGYLALAFVLARIAWGFVGSRHARFADFFPTASRLRLHLEHLRAGRFVPHDGHNPLGALMILALLTAVVAIGATGWMQTLDAFWGEQWLEELHVGVSHALIGLAATHALAAIVIGRLERTRLIRAMFTGVKERW